MMSIGPPLLEHLEHADVRAAAGAPAGQHQPQRAHARRPRIAASVAGAAGPAARQTSPPAGSASGRTRSSQAGLTRERRIIAVRLCRRRGFHLRPAGSGATAPAPKLLERSGHVRRTRYGHQVITQPGGPARSGEQSPHRSGIDSPTGCGGHLRHAPRYEAPATLCTELRQPGSVHPVRRPAPVPARANSVPREPRPPLSTLGRRCRPGPHASTTARADCHAPRPPPEV